MGSLNALITALVIWVLMKGVGCYYLWSNIAGYVAALVNNFFWSNYWIFSYRSGKFERELMVEIGDMNEYLAQFLGLFVYGAVNFTMNKRLTFTRKQ